MRRNSQTPTRPHLHSHSHRTVHHWHHEKENVSSAGNRREGEPARRKDWALPVQVQREARGPSPSVELEEEYSRNQRKIERLSCKLDELYRHFQQQTLRLAEGKKRVEQMGRMEA